MQYKNLVSRLGFAGLEFIEAPIMVGWALGLPFRLIGKPGTAKTRLADRLSVAENGPSSYRRFDCPKENIVTIAGLPDIEAMKRSKFSFVHETDGANDFIWDKKNVTFNEINRATAEALNNLLEPLMEGTFFGQPLPFQRKFGNPENIHYSVISTENPDGVGVRRVDGALLDRFYMAVNVPDFQKVAGHDIRRGIVTSNLARYHGETDCDDVISAFAITLRREFGQVMRDVAITHPVVEYSVSLWETFMDGNQSEGVYVSNRRQAMVTELILAFAAYQRVVADSIDLSEAANNALDYGVIVPLMLNTQQTANLRSAHNKAKLLLNRVDMTEKEKFEAELQSRLSIADRIAFITSNKDKFVELLKIDERENILGSRLLSDKSTQPTDLLEIHRLLATLCAHDELFRKCEVKIIHAVSRAIFDLQSTLSRVAITSFEDLEVFDYYNQFMSRLSKGSLPIGVIQYLLKPQTDSVALQIQSLLAICEREDQRVAEPIAA